MTERCGIFSVGRFGFFVVLHPKGPGEVICPVSISVRDDGEVYPLEEAHHPRPHADVAVFTKSTTEASTFLIYISSPINDL